MFLPAQWIRLPIHNEDLGHMHQHLDHKCGQMERNATEHTRNHQPLQNLCNKPQTFHFNYPLRVAISNHAML